MTQTLQSGTQVYTFEDIVQAVLDSHDVDRTGLNLRRARRAVIKAYTSLPQRHAWSYYYRQRLIQTVDDYGTGTVDFDYTGGSYELQLTLTGGTWPSWAAFGRVIIGSVHYDVDDRKSDTVLTLTASSNPGEDLTGQSYTLYRDAYPLPADFGVLSRLWDIAAGFPVHMVDEVQQHVAWQRLDRNPGQPRRAAIRGTGKYQGLREIVFGPPPSTATTYDLFYQARPRPLTIDDYSTGTVAVSAAGTTVTGTNTAFPSNCAGSIIRFSSGGTKPSSVVGSLDGADNPLVFQDVIKSYTSATSIELMSGAPVAIASGSGFVISDPLDIEWNIMYEALRLAAEAEFSRLAGRADAAARDALARQELLKAMEADVAVENNTGMVLYNPFKRAPVITQ